jgi:galactonate dehydratase
MRKAVGPDVDILIDAHGNMGVASAIIVGKRLEELNPFFYEEPVATMNVDTMKKVAEKVSIPLAGGERLYTRFGFRPFIEEQAMEILQPDVGLAGGITEVKKIAAGAETYDILMQPHNCSSPLMTAACVQLDACITNFVIQEVFPYREEDLLHVVREPLESRTAAGVIDIPATPGLGIELNEEYIKPYLYKTLV